jgi:serine/threonine-protein phosphatase 2A regulatory subunit A
MEIARVENFRVKIEIIRLICFFLPFISPEALTVQLIPLIGQWLQDSVFLVREEACHALPALIQVAKNDSFRDEVIALLSRLNYSPSYSIRQVALFSVLYICDILPRSIVSEKILPSVLLIASDPVANVRLLAAKTLVKMKDYVDRRGLPQINLCLKLLANDPDSDVKFYATH